MLLAAKFGMYYIDENGEKALPYIIHRTSLGCYERTLAYLIEKYAGALPTWMAPEQVRVLPITDRTMEYGRDMMKMLEQCGVRVTLDERSEKIGKKIRDAQLEKVPYMLVLGDKEAEEGMVAVRSRKTGETEVMTPDAFRAKLLEEIATKAK